MTVGKRSGRAADQDGGIDAGMRWAFRTVEADLRTRGAQRINNSLPAGFCTQALRFIRAQACRKAASDEGKAIDCAKWGSSASGPTLRASDYVCEACTHPHVTSAVLIDTLGLASGREEFSDRTWRRYINEGHAMAPDQLQRAVANALGQGWIEVLHTASIWAQIDQLAAMQRAVRALKDRVSERKAYLQHGEIEFSRKEVVAEFDKQMRIIAREATASIDQRLKVKDLPREARELMAEALVERML